MSGSAYIERKIMRNRYAGNTGFGSENVVGVGDWGRGGKGEYWHRVAMGGVLCQIFELQFKDD